MHGRVLAPSSPTSRRATGSDRPSPAPRSSRLRRTCRCRRVVADDRDREQREAGRAREPLDGERVGEHHDRRAGGRAARPRADRRSRRRRHPAPRAQRRPSRCTDALRWRRRSRARRSGRPAGRCRREGRWAARTPGGRAARAPRSARARARETGLGEHLAFGEVGAEHAPGAPLGRRRPRPGGRAPPARRPPRSEVDVERRPAREVARRHHDRGRLPDVGTGRLERGDVRRTTSTAPTAATAAPANHTTAERGSLRAKMSTCPRRVRRRSSRRFRDARHIGAGSRSLGMRPPRGARSVLVPSPSASARAAARAAGTPRAPRDRRSAPSPPAPGRPAPAGPRRCGT